MLSSCISPCFFSLLEEVFFRIAFHGAGFELTENANSCLLFLEQINYLQATQDGVQLCGCQRLAKWHTASINMISVRRKGLCNQCRWYQGTSISLIMYIGLIEIRVTSIKMENVSKGRRWKYENIEPSFFQATVLDWYCFWNWQFCHRSPHGPVVIS